MMPTKPAADSVISASALQGAGRPPETPLQDDDPPQGLQTPEALQMLIAGHRLELKTAAMVVPFQPSRFRQY